MTTRDCTSAAGAERSDTAPNRARLRDEAETDFHEAHTSGFDDSELRMID
ncbi:hypothetical protein ACFV7R_43955 [Streptomyces sp. NPDC059866]